ncbi:uncharacterized protein EI90DRAFT_2926448, partial [Cantharellus anzutake]|uniref:uncharacterized protein n=1 Tax=Cantharellus anzutake TaxID=1750568 RepID=UPI001906421F
LSTTPPDVIELIAYYAATSDLPGPPRDIVPLLSTCRTIYYSLSFQHNHGLYADIFRFKFDCGAPIRRFANDPLCRTSSTGLSLELRSRFEALRYMRTVVQTKTCITHSKEETIRHLWTIYFMCTESDRKNFVQLVSYGDLKTFLRVCMEELLLPAIETEEYVLETLDRTLVAWILWLSTTLGKPPSETRCCPFNSFSGRIYSAYLAPWMIFRISPEKDSNRPLPRFKPCQPDQGSTDRYAANVRLEDRSVVVSLYGYPICLTPPLLSHAAFLSYFVRLERRSLYEANDLGTVKYVSRRLPCMKDSSRLDGDFYRWVKVASSFESCVDRYDFRLRTCVDPHTWQRKTRFLPPGMFTGDWEGKFAFTDFDSFRDMLDGDDDAIHSATIGQQPQVWSIREHQHNPKLAAALESWGHTDRHGVHRAPISTKPVLPGPSLNAHLPEDVEIEEVHPDYGMIHFASFSGIDEHSFGGLEDDSEEEDESDIILTGKGHSAWGLFELKGRVRRWDGLISIVKTYVSDEGRGSWLYRGYILSGGIWVGRWRDTLTDEDTNGYEGAFAMTRRTEP